MASQAADLPDLPLYPSPSQLYGLFSICVFKSRSTVLALCVCVCVCVCSFSP